MSNSTTFLPVHTVTFTMFFVPFQIIFSWLTNSINIYILTRPNLLRNSACTYYFLVISICSFLYIFVGPLLQFIHFWYPLQASIPIIGCPFLAYLNIFLPFEITTLLVFASWDRFCASSISTTTRSWSSISIAQKIILSSIIINGIILSPYLSVWRVDITQGKLLCFQDVTNIIQMLTLLQTMIFNGICPIAMIIFSTLTIRNIRKQKIRSGCRIRRRTECDLCWMMLLQVSVFILLNLPVTVTYTCIIFIPILRTQFSYFLLHVLHLLYQCTHFLNFFLYIISGSLYRREVQRMLLHLLRIMLQLLN